MAQPDNTNFEGPSKTSTTGFSDKYPVVSEHPSQRHLGVLPVMPDRFQQPEYQQQQQHSQYSAAYPAGQYDGLARGPARTRNPWGLSPLAFGLLIAAVTAAIVGGAVGGGVAGSKSSKHCSSSDLSSPATSTTTITADGSSATATATATGTSTSSTSTTSLPLPSSLQNFVAPEPYYIGSLATPSCSAQDSRLEIPEFNDFFDLSCGNDMVNNVPDLTNPSLMVVDVVGLFAYSITDCLYACANVRSLVAQWGQSGNMQTCQGVTWSWAMAQSNTSHGANCWLKNGTSAGKASDSCVSARLVQ